LWACENKPVFSEIRTKIELIDTSGKSIIFEDEDGSRLGGTRLYSVIPSDGFVSPAAPDTIPAIPSVLRVDSPPDILFTRPEERYSSDDVAPFIGTFVAGHTTVSIRCYPELDTIYTPEYDTTYNFYFRAKIVGVCDEHCF